MKRYNPGDAPRASADRASEQQTLSLVLLALCALCLPERTYGTGGWTQLATQPNDSIGICLLLPDGTVLAEGSNANWWQLKPDNKGQYVNGQWCQRQSSTWGLQDGSTAVLKNGNVFVGGGENGNGSSQVEIFNTASGSWSIAVNPTYFGGISDGNAMQLSDGRIMIYPPNSTTYIFDPGNNTFSQTTGAPLNGLSETSWVKLPNDDVLVIDSGNVSPGATTAEIYNPSTGYWQNAITGGTVPNIWPDVTGTGKVSEMGPAFLLPNGNAIFFGGNGVTAVYSNGIWSQCATLPYGLGMKDAPGAMMADGRILLAVCPTGNNADVNDINGVGPTTFYEYDYTANGGAGGYIPTSSPGGGISGRAQALKMLDLPDGTVLLSPGGNQLYVYQPDGPPLPAGKPGISSITLNGNGSYHLTGTQLNGISGGAAYGDNEQMDSNYPLVRLTDGAGKKYYARTHDWSSTSVQTGNRSVTTEFDLPPGLTIPGNYSLEVVANGIPSDPYPVFLNGPVWVAFGGPDPGIGTYDRPYNTLAAGRDAAGSPGLILIKGPGSTRETITIAKHVTLNAVGGTVTIGRN
jgi:hypothetical protein